MNFLIVAPRYHINLHDRVRSLRRGGHHVEVLAQYRGDSEDYSEAEPEIIGYSSWYRPIEWLVRKASGASKARAHQIRFGFPSIRRLYMEIRDRPSDLVLMKGLNSALGLSTLLVARILNIRSVVLVQREWFRAKSVVERMRCFVLFRVLGVVSVTSPISKHTWSDPANHPRFGYLPFVYDVVDFNRDYFQHDLINVLNVGKFVPGKGQATLLRAVNQLRTKFPIEVTLIGTRVNEGYLRKLQTLVEELQLEPLVHFEFDQDHRSVLAAYRTADLLVLSSDREPASLQVLEAMANKVPVVSSDKNGTRCYIEDGISGLVFKALDPADLAKKMESIMRDRSKLQKMGERGFQIAQERHSLRHFASALERMVAGS